MREGVWYYGDVEYVCANGLMTGTGAAAFSPDAPMTRAMLVTVLYRYAAGDGGR
ncbi:MAG: S-layer homology domain-containing protein, partial [Gracilibacteraceae bacterium]|nr:S-layer homology domain-containing protein [Gracilibacteraceae bacterium]